MGVTVQMSSIGPHRYKPGKKRIPLVQVLLSGIEAVLALALIVLK